MRFRLIYHLRCFKSFMGLCPACLGRLCPDPHDTTGQGVLLSETKTGWAAASCMAVVSCAAWLIIRRVTRTRPTRRVTDAAARRPSTRASATRARVFTAWVWCDKSSPFCLNMYTQTPWPNGRPVHFLKLPGSWEVSLSIRLSSVSCLVRHDQMMSRPDDRERQDPMNPNTCPRAKKGVEPQ